LRVSDSEHSEILSRADRAGVSVSAYFRAAALGGKPLRAERQPAINRREVARLLGEIMRLREALVAAARQGDKARCTHLVESFDRDFWELDASINGAILRD
jgi:hypothetical protein